MAASPNATLWDEAQSDDENEALKWSRSGQCKAGRLCLTCTCGAGSWHVLSASVHRSLRLIAVYMEGGKHVEADMPED